MKYMKQILFLLCFLTWLSPIAAKPIEGASTKGNSDPNAVKLVTSDITNFWKAYSLATPTNRLEVFTREYFDKGSVGLREFTEARFKTPQVFVKRLYKDQARYQKIEQATLRINEQQKPILDVLRKFKSLYPRAIFPNIYFLMGLAGSGSTVGPSGLLMSVDTVGCVENDTRIDTLHIVIAHELIHFQQGDEPKTLLGKAIQEGSADFLGQLISGALQPCNLPVYTYGRAHEAELWQEFKKEMDGTDTKRWFYNEQKDRPQDLGYFMGYQITSAYYQQHSDKQQAVQDILEMKDVEKILELSKYGEKF